MRGIYPTMATITGRGFESVTEDEIAERFRGLLDRLATSEDTTADAGLSPTMSSNAAENGATS